MKKSTRFAFLFFSLFVTARVKAQNTWWTMTSGSSTPNVAPVWGTKGQASIGSSTPNTPGGRGNHSGWMDPTSGYYWIFGGTNTKQGLFNDLWEFIPSYGLWIWVAGDSTVTTPTPGVYGTEGIPAPANKPGGREGQSGFADSKGNFWIFGGYGYDVNGHVQYLNDLWRYSAGSWTWMSGDNTGNNQGIYATVSTEGPTNKPGARVFASTWMDASGYIWLFGGYGIDGNNKQGPLNDLWRFDTTSKQWAWVAGSNTINQNGSYGTINQPSNQNTPGSRFGQSVIADAQGNFWLFGGTTAPSVDVNSPTTIAGYFNDLWEFTPGKGSSPITGAWTWVAGSSAVNENGHYNKQNVYSANSQPGARFQQALEIDNNGNLWVWGGYGVDAHPDEFSLLNDLWVYNPNNRQWAWANGDSIGNQPSSVTQLNTPAATNTPSGRQGFAYWMDRVSNLWIMGGGGGGGTPSGGVGTWYDDVWFSPLSVIDLAIQEVSLQGTAQGNDNLLTWQTVNEIDEVGFTVERSTDGISFTDIGSVPSAGNGNHQYSFTDDHLPAGSSTFYYRLKETDNLGNIVYSQTIVLNGVVTGNITLYPNPATSGAILSIPGNSTLIGTTARLYDLGGRFLSEQLISSPQQYINLNSLAGGVYLLKLANGQTLKLIKE
jgi:hypothetical protein